MNIRRKDEAGRSRFQATNCEDERTPREGHPSRTPVGRPPSGWKGWHDRGRHDRGRPPPATPEEEAGGAERTSWEGLRPERSGGRPDPARPGATRGQSERPGQSPSE